MSELLQASARPISNDQNSISPNKKKLMAVKIFLLGMPGAGKSYWSNFLKKKLKLPFYDLDTLVEVMDDRTVGEIFNEDGEGYFRKAETKMLHLFSEKKQFILATGGGTPCHGNNMEWMNRNGITIWIDESIDVLCQRLLNESDQRPLLKYMDGKQLRNYLEETLKERKPFYENAMNKLSGADITESNFVEIIKKYA